MVVRYGGKPPAPGDPRSIEMMSDFALAFGVELEFKITPLKEPQATLNEDTR